MKVRHYNRAPLMAMAATLLVCLGWILISKYVAPEIIRSAYQGTSWWFFNRMITGQATNPLATYLGRWSAFAWYLLLGLLLLGLLTTLATWPEIRDAFWGEDPVPCSRIESPPVAQEKPNSNTALSWRQRLAAFVRSWNLTPWLVAAILLALSLRLALLGSKGFSEDEMFSFAIAHKHLLGFWDTVTRGEANMVLYYVILHFWILIGQSEFAARGLSVLVGVATVPALYWLGTRAFGHRVGILGALLLAVNGFHIEFSQDARSYVLLVFLVTLSSFYFLRSVREGSRRDWTCYIVTSTLAIYTHLFAVLVLVSQGVSLLFPSPHRAPWRRMIPSTAAIAFLALPMEWLVLRGNDGQLSWVPRTTAEGVYKLFARLAGQPQFSPLRHGAILLLLAYSIPVAVAIVALIRPSLHSKDAMERWTLGFFLTWLLVPILLTLAISVREPAFIARYLIICLPPFVLLASYGISRFQGTWPVVVFLCLIAGLTAHELLPYYRSPGEDWRGAAEYVISNGRSNDVATFSPRYFKAKFEYYFGKEPRAAGSLQEHPPLLIPSSDTFGPFLRSLPSHYDRVWLVTRENPTVKAFLLQKRLVEASLSAEFPGVPQVKQFSGGLEVVLYSKEVLH